MRPHQIKPVLDAAMDDLITLLKDATTYLHHGGHDLAVIGTLATLDDRVMDVKSALHLFRMALHKRSAS